MNKEQALHQFWSGFGWAARDENTVPDDAMTRYNGHYITYAVSTASLGEPVPISGNLWCKDASLPETALLRACPTTMTAVQKWRRPRSIRQSRWC